LGEGVAGGGEAPFGEAGEGIDAEIEVGFVAEFAQRGFEAGAGDGGPGKIKREVEGLFVEPVAEAGLEDFEDAGLEEYFRIGVGGFGFGDGVHGVLEGREIRNRKRKGMGLMGRKASDAE